MSEQFHVQNSTNDLATACFTLLEVKRVARRLRYNKWKVGQCKVLTTQPPKLAWCRVSLVQRNSCPASPHN